jgi:hypothetical protein
LFFALASSPRCAEPQRINRRASCVAMNLKRRDADPVNGIYSFGKNG